MENYIVYNTHGTESDSMLKLNMNLLTEPGLNAATYVIGHGRGTLTIPDPLSTFHLHFSQPVGARPI